MANYQKMFEKDYQKLSEKFNKTNEEFKQLKYEYKLLNSKYQTKCKQMENIIEAADNTAKEKYESVIIEKDKIIEEKDKEIERLKALLNMDGTNSGISTSKTPLNKNKIIPSSREKSDKSIGGQKGHPKHKLEKFKDEEVTEIEKHDLTECPKCGGTLEKIAEIYKDELSYKVVPIKRRHVFERYKCSCCKNEVHEEIPVRLKEENQYGSEVQALALSLGNEGNVSINKICRLIKGITHNEICPSEGYIAKLQKRASKKLEKFNEDVFKELLKQDIVNWDDTVIMVDKKRACFRFYGTNKLALYKAHLQKNKDGVDEDGLLNTLSANVKVVHDHNIINYNQDYSFINVECNEHLKRDLQKCFDNTQHDWAKKLKELIQKAIHDRKTIINKLSESNEENKLINLGKISFDQDYLIAFDTSFNDYILDGIAINKNSKNHYYYKDELALINRILDYKENYFMWLYDFSIPPDNNLSERSLRGIKSKMKISGQFQNIKNAEFHANIKTYIETCYRNDINPTDALISLMEDRPLELSEIIKKE